MNVYIASSLENAERIIKIRNILNERGINITYDWTCHGYVDDPAKLREIAKSEYNGVINAACVLLVLPARIGSHFEFGVAYAKGIPVVILDEAHDKRELAFYYLPSLYKCDTLEDAINKVIGVVKHNVV